MGRRAGDEGLVDEVSTGTGSDGASLTFSFGSPTSFAVIDHRSFERALRQVADLPRIRVAEPEHNRSLTSSCLHNLVGDSGKSPSISSPTDAHPVATAPGTDSKALAPTLSQRREPYFTLG